MKEYKLNSRKQNGMREREHTGAVTKVYEHDTDTSLDNVDIETDKTTAQKNNSFLEKNSKTIITARNVVLLCLYLAYFCYAMYCNFGDEGSIRLAVFTAFGLSYIGWKRASKYEDFHRRKHNIVKAIYKTYRHGQRSKYINWFLYLVWTGVLVTYLVIDVGLKDPSKLRSLGGYVVFVIILVLISNNKRLINWHCVFWGSAVQCLLGYFVIKSVAGRTLIMWFSDRLSEFMGHSRAGAVFAFGESYRDHFFVMEAMPSVLVFCAVIQVLIYLGTIQFIVRTLGKLVAVILDVSAPEATNACANIFLGGIESALLVIEYIDKMPTSRLFTLMTNWFASCGGSALMQFIAFGVPASYLLAASAMSAPAALVCAKLAFPDVDQLEYDDSQSDVALDVVTEKSGIDNESFKHAPDDIPLDEIAIKNNRGNLKTDDESKREYDQRLSENNDVGNSLKKSSIDANSNKNNNEDKKDIENKSQRGKRVAHAPKSIGEALVLGTTQGLKLVTNIVGNMIVSLSVLELLDQTVAWFGDRINIDISLTSILSYVFYPFVYIMGVDTADCMRAGKMLGIRTISSAGISYRDLGQLIDNRAVLEDYTSNFNANFTYERDSDIFLPLINKTLVGGVFTERSEVVVSYALCGFASVPMIGMTLGALAVLIPDRAPEITALAFKALLTGTFASYLTACVAGLVA